MRRRRHGLDERAWREVLAGAGLGVLGVLFADALVDVALGVGVERGAGDFVDHLEEDEVGELLQVVAVAHAVVAERVVEGPDFGDDAVGGPVLAVSPFSSRRPASHVS